MWVALISFIPAMIKAVASGWERTQQVKQAKHETQLKIELAKQEYLAVASKNESDLRIKQLESTSSWFKVVTFSGWFIPYFLSIIFPEYAAQLWTNLSAAPQWYIETCQIILFTVWGVSVGKEPVMSVFSNMSKYFEQKRRAESYKREVKEVQQDLINTAKDMISEKAMFDALRAVNGGVLSQELVDAVKKELNK